MLQTILTNAPALLAALASIIAGASILANFTKTDADNKALGIISNIIHVLALNFTSGSVTPPK